MAVILVSAATAGARQGSMLWFDLPGDATLRRTDPGNNGPISTETVLPDVVQATLSGWAPFSPCTDPYTGVVVTAFPHILRLDVVFAGLVNPPGPIGIGIPQPPFDPHRYGPSPVYGFLEVDVDNDIDTGGEMDPQARFRYLGNVARFGRRPIGPLGARIAETSCQYSPSCPSYIHSGGDWALTFCGCFPVTIEQEGGTPPNGLFEIGETWIVRSRFFQRIGGYKCSSGASGGSDLGLYDPWVNVRFSHNPFTNRTTVTLVYPLDMAGAAQLACQPQQVVNLNVADHTSILEGLVDVIGKAPTTTGCCKTLVQNLIGANPGAFLHPTMWQLRGIFGTSYSVPEDAFYAWTDTCFADVAGDVNADGLMNSGDRVLVQNRIAALDGSPAACGDCDGTVNGSVTICDYGPNFDLFDLTGDGKISPLDISFTCPADFNGDGQLTPGDFSAFQTAFVLGDLRADFTHDGLLTVADTAAFQTAFVSGCP